MWGVVLQALCPINPENRVGGNTRMVQNPQAARITLQQKYTLYRYMGPYGTLQDPPGNCRNFIMRNLVFAKLQAFTRAFADAAEP